MTTSLEEIRTKIKKGRDITSATLDSYIRNINAFFSKFLLINTEDKFSLLPLSNFSNVKSQLDLIPASTRANYLIAISVMLKEYKSFAKTKITVNNEKVSIHQTYRDYLVSSNNIVKEKYSQHSLSQVQKDNWLPFKDIIKKRKEIRNNLNIDFDILKTLEPEERYTYVKNNYLVRDIDEVQQWIVLCYYTMIPPQRNEAATLIVVKDNESIPDNQNYILMRDKKIILKHYKTRRLQERKQKKNGTNKNLDIIIDIPDNLYKAIELWLLINPTHFFLINCRKNTPMSKNNLTKFIQKIFAPRKISTTLLRKIYWDHKFPLTNNREDMQQLAQDMMHSFQTANLIYRKYATNNS